MEQAFRALLTGSAAVTALVPVARINWGAHPQGQPVPAIVLTVVSGAEGLNMQGGDGVLAGRVQVDCYAATYSGVKAVARAVQGVLHAHSDASLRLVAHVGTRDSRESGSNEADRPYRVSLDFQTQWRAT